MFRIISVLFDRCLFTLTFILGLQLPEFIQQYSQRLSGHLNEALSQLSEYQLIADRHFEGNLDVMVNKYLANSEVSINETANIISNVSLRVSHLEEHLLHLQDAEYIQRVFFFATEFDKSMAQATLDQYQLAIPLSLPSLISGALFALFVVIFIHSLLYCFRKLFKQKNISAQKVENTPKKLKPVKKTIQNKTKVIPKIGDLNNLHSDKL